MHSILFFQSKSREQREAEVIPRVTKALSLGINVLDTAFEQLDPHIGDSDSEEEEATYKAVDPILEPKVCWHEVPAKEKKR